MFTEYHSTYNGLAKSQVKTQWHLILAKTQLSLNLEKPSFSYLALKHNHFKWCLPSLHSFGYAGAHSHTHTHSYKQPNNVVLDIRRYVFRFRVLFSHPFYRFIFRFIGNLPRKFLHSQGILLCHLCCYCCLFCVVPFRFSNGSFLRWDYRPKTFSVNSNGITQFK